MDIKSLQELLSSISIVSYKVTRLNQSGENYGSILLSLTILSEDEKTLSLVAKVPPDNRIFWKLFNIPVTFSKEANFYKHIVPCINAFETKYGSNKSILECFPHYYATRINLNNGPDVDEDGCIILENLKTLGFTNVDRISGFDRQAAEYTICKLAEFHAVPIAMKMKNKNVFENNIKPLLRSHLLNDDDTQKMHQQFKNTTINGIENITEVSKYIPQIAKKIDENIHNYLQMQFKYEEPFASFIHLDFWTNNIMIKLDDDGQPVQCAIIDFQTIMYGNPAHDLIFYIYSSLNPEDIKLNYNQYINLYYNSFMTKLNEYGVNLDFSRDMLDRQITLAMSQWEAYHILFMYKPIYTVKISDLNNIDENEMESFSSVSPKYYEKMKFTVMAFAERGWI